MNDSEDVSQELQDLIDDYLEGTLDEAGLSALEGQLRAQAAARQHFVRYCGLHTDLCLEVRGRKAGRRTLRLLDQEDTGHAEEPKDSPAAAASSLTVLSWLTSAPTLRAAAATLLLLLAGAWFWYQPASEQPPPPRRAIAWLVNAQNCQWAAGAEPARDLYPGVVLRIEQGLAELCFETGARVVLEGPAEFGLISNNSAQLLQGRLTARVPESAIGFSLLLPGGEVIDHGTEFGVSVAEDGSGRVSVFDGMVEARSTARDSQPANLRTEQTALVDASGVARQSKFAGQNDVPFVRKIEAAPVLVPRTLTLDFRQPVERSLRDAAGLGTGLTHRLPGTGTDLLENDAELTLDLVAKQLTINATRSDLNGQWDLEYGEYVGIRLSELGFTGEEDFAVSLTVPRIPQLQAWSGQLGLYAGTRSDKNIRGGLLSRETATFAQFLVHNDGGQDSALHMIGIATPGEEVQFTLRRVSGKYTLTVENRTTADTSTLAIRPAEFLAGEKDLYVGMFAANASREPNRNLVAQEFQVTVWTRSP